MHSPPDTSRPTVLMTLSELRRNLRMTLDDVIARIGQDPTYTGTPPDRSTLSRIERGDTKSPNPALMSAWHRALGVREVPPDGH